ncbi:OmpA family protein [Hymenobacter sp. GOD-10R]|uniref:OmpA family protein n=1 Tax=Hymenobacter sp. GOD-10R TaxID=3093922 RepID=UPI002D766317|nr:OmpA family protein [Hymenobacter sp. GOD-10R]WRQ26540.1 OmpA family protein [Hymenobacter sp. GOD-10R]
MQSSAALAQTAERRTSIGINGSVLQYKGDFGSEYWQFTQKRYAPGLAINQYLTKGIDLNAQLFYGQLTGQPSTTTSFTSTLVNANVGFKFKLNNGWALKEKAVIQPYLFAGSGWTFASRTGLADGIRINTEKGYVDVLAGAGLNLRLGGSLGLFVQSSQHLPMYADLDGLTQEKPSRWADRFLQHTVGLTINLGQAPDADEDGVPDRLDQCPHTPNDIEVDAHGCPLDDDKDGVPNYQDQCPSIPGKPEVHGCPDRDNDGVDDVDDACPDKPGSIELHGCPDTDQDGVSDSDDQCPDTPVGTAVNAQGCPAPSVASDTVVSTKSASSSLDIDGDGVPNTEDRCPDHAGPVTNHGCPEIQAATRQRLQEATKLIGFERNNATLLPASYSTLDTIARILTQYPDYSLSIAGHTDSQGPAAFNLRLSRERAASARRYLLERGLPEARVEWRGYGPRYPLAANTTEAGRARNRRVEFDLFLTGDPNTAQAKYGPEPTPSALVTPKKGKATPLKKKPVPRKTVSKPRSGKQTIRKQPSRTPRRAPKQPTLEW